MVLERKKNLKNKISPTKVPWVVAQAPMAGVFTKKRLDTPGRGLGEFKF
jgi:hypothetical protein